MVPHMRFFSAFILAVLLLGGGAAHGSSDIASLEERLEEERVAIERDRKALNADCGMTSPWIRRRWRPAGHAIMT